jgi:uncharacterized DUF497 family protein
MQFEWDENKRLRTIKERGIDFIDMVHIWDDPNCQERFDTRVSYGEDRIQIIGKFKYDIFFVVYTERSYDNGEEIIRIISARRATSKERDLYITRTFPYTEAI